MYLSSIETNSTYRNVPRLKRVHHAEAEGVRQQHSHQDVWGGTARRLSRKKTSRVEQSLLRGHSKEKAQQEFRGRFSVVGHIPCPHSLAGFGVSVAAGTHVRDGHERFGWATRRCSKGIDKQVSIYYCFLFQFKRKKSLWKMIHVKKNSKIYASNFPIFSFLYGFSEL